MLETSAPLDGYTIAFDLDGTLVDTIGDLHRALNHVLAMEKLPLASIEDVRVYVGQGARSLIIRACSVHGVHPSDMKIDLLTEEYVEAYAKDIAAHSAPFPGVIAALDTLKARGASLCVCTNKGTRLSNQLLEAVGLSKYFAAVIGADQLRNRKPHPDHYLFAIRSARGTPARSLMIGDSANDVQSAKAAGAPVAVYAYGYTDTAPDLLGADAVFKHFEELPDLAVRLLNYQPTPRV
ncbi:MAG TPA: phosphoglycolate phosphatase [Hyphomonadaceae bacterium]|nr:phosphoglycolate phosphatase [Hyphomonadaceae bacterium]HPN05839.1 phosphoglycolate phosphatase [Hyphomonadaceae bacterium]